MNLVQKYAHAYLNVSGDKLTYQDAVHCTDAAQFLHSHGRALFLLKVPLIPSEIKREGLVDLVTRFKLPDSIKQLIDLLLLHKQAFLLADILDAISTIYAKEHSIHTVIVTSTIELAAQQREEIENFLADRMQGTIIYKYEINKKLIAGIRIQSDTLLWEHSIDKQLRELLFARNQ